MDAGFIAHRKGINWNRRLDYIPEISVSAGTYRFRFIGMNTFVRRPTDSIKWGLVTIQIATSKAVTCTMALWPME